ncbi:hypothetical protein K7432_009863 [Basidiobolus ranarum]|uniref:Uncharacterized protein n=1 Tax=Basidiobolus ranarum TaxID=34480 RepID=A0ABR2VWF6_9FUNG
MFGSPFRFRSGLSVLEFEYPDWHFLSISLWDTIGNPSCLGGLIDLKHFEGIECVEERPDAFAFIFVDEKIDRSALANYDDTNKMIQNTGADVQ